MFYCSVCLGIHNNSETAMALVILCFLNSSFSKNCFSALVGIFFASKSAVFISGWDHTAFVEVDLCCQPWWSQNKWEWVKLFSVFSVKRIVLVISAEGMWPTRDSFLVWGVLPYCFFDNSKSNKNTWIVSLTWLKVTWEWLSRSKIGSKSEQKTSYISLRSSVSHDHLQSQP